jgi:hypothetical protein
MLGMNRGYIFQPEVTGASRKNKNVLSLNGVKCDLSK